MPASLRPHQAQCWAQIQRLYVDGSKYGEDLTQDAHACQSAQLAVEAGADDLTVTACLLHDIGWKLAHAEPTVADGARVPAAGTVFDAKPGSPADRMGILSFCGSSGAGEEQQRAQHDVIGATYLRMLGFDEKVPHLVEGHVLAKRYLCWKEPGYFAKLSPASVRTLRFQGGAMSAAEAAVFEADPLFAQCMQMRRWDEAAKRVGWSVPDFKSHEGRVAAAVVRAPVAAAATRGSFVRSGNRLVAVRTDVARL